MPLESRSALPAAAAARPAAATAAGGGSACATGWRWRQGSSRSAAACTGAGGAARQRRRKRDRRDRLTGQQRLLLATSACSVARAASWLSRNWRCSWAVCSCIRWNASRLCWVIPSALARAVGSAGGFVGGHSSTSSGRVAAVAGGRGWRGVGRRFGVVAAAAFCRWRTEAAARLRADVVRPDDRHGQPRAWRSAPR